MVTSVVCPSFEQTQVMVSSSRADAGAAMPPTINAASKQGAVDESRSEVVLVNAPHGDFVFCVITKDLQDTSWKRENEASTLIRKVSSMLWNYFEPNFGWSPLPESEKWQK